MTTTTLKDTMTEDDFIYIFDIPISASDLLNKLIQENNP